MPKDSMYTPLNCGIGLDAVTPTPTSSTVFWKDPSLLNLDPTNPQSSLATSPFLPCRNTSTELQAKTQKTLFMVFYAREFILLHGLIVLCIQ